MPARTPSSALFCSSSARRARLVQRLADVVGRPLDSGPPRPVRHEELVLVRIGPRHRLGDALGDELLRLFLEAIRQPLQEEQAEDVGLVVAAVDRSAQDVRRRPEVLLELRDAQHLVGRARCVPGRSRRRRRRGYLVAPRRSGRHHEAHDEIYFLSTGIIQAERPAQLFQAVPEESPENLIQTSTARTGKRVDELRLDAAIGNLQLVVVDIRAELLGSQLSENGALRWHRRAPPFRSIVGLGRPTWTRTPRAERARSRAASLLSRSAMHTQNARARDDCSYALGSARCDVHLAPWASSWRTASAMVFMTATCTPESSGRGAASSLLADRNIEHVAPDADRAHRRPTDSPRVRVGDVHRIASIPPTPSSRWTSGIGEQRWSIGFLNISFLQQGARGRDGPAASSASVIPPARRTRRAGGLPGT